MRKILFTSVALSTALMSIAQVGAYHWSIVPDAEELCESDTVFRVNEDDDFYQQQAAKYAKLRFCNLVFSHPL